MELLSEQLTISDHIANTVTNSSNSSNGTALDMRDYHRVIAYGMCDWSTTGGTSSVALNLKIQASTSTTFGTPTTITSTSFASSVSTTGSTDISVSCDGEAIQTQRVAEDRYVRVVSLADSDKAGHVMSTRTLVLRGNSRYKPS